MERHIPQNEAWSVFLPLTEHLPQTFCRSAALRACQVYQGEEMNKIRFAQVEGDGGLLWKPQKEPKRKQEEKEKAWEAQTRSKCVFALYDDDDQQLSTNLSQGRPQMVYCSRKGEGGQK